MNNKYELLVLDVDGTLVDKNGRISAADKKALERVAEKGVKIALSTGRVIAACRPILEELSLDGCHVFYDGALVTNLSKQEEIYARSIKPELVKQAVEFCRANDSYLELYSTSQFFAERENWSDDIHRRFFHSGPTIVNFDGIWEKERIIKAELLSRSPEEAARVKSFEKHFEGKLSFSVARTPAFPDIEFINIVDSGVSKGEALETLVAHLGVPMEKVMAIGDGDNDITQLERVGLAVAMGNGRESVKQIADYITLDIDDSGVAAAVEEFLL